MENAIAYSLGLLGLLQALLIPGLCVTVALPGWNRLQRWIYAVPLSLLLNHYLVCLLVALGIYGRNSMIALMAEELAWIIWQWRRQPAAGVRYVKLEMWSELFWLVWAVAAFTKYLQAWGRMFGGVFEEWDALASWNLWAKEWFLGHLPISGSYPNGLPILYSLPYAWMGRTELETFSKASAGLIFLAMLLALIELGFRKKEIRTLAWATVFFYPEFLSRFLQSHWSSGYADVPVSAFTAFGFCLSFFETAEMPYLYGLVAGAAALVKQPGLLFAGLSPVIARGWEGFPKAKFLWPRIALAAALAAGPYYGFLLAKIFIFHTSSHNTEHLVHLVPGGPVEHWAFTLRMLQLSGGPALYFYWGLVALLGVAVSPIARRWVLVFGLPWFLIWGTFFGYDLRNMAMALFPWALAFAAGMAFLLSAVEMRIGKAARELLSRAFAQKFLVAPNVLWRTIAIVSAVLLLAALIKPIRHWRQSGSLSAWEEEQRLVIGDFPRANLEFAKFLPCAAQGKIQLFSNYDWFQLIPAFQETVERVECNQIAEMVKTGGNGYALFDSRFCKPEAVAAVRGLKSLYSDGWVYLVALNPALPGSCTSR